MGNDQSKQGHKSDERAEKEIAVLKSASKLSESETKQLYEKLKADYPSGKLDKQQFVTVYQQIMGFEDQYDLFANRAFQVFDTNHNGSIEFSELVLACAAGAKSDMDAALELSFHVLDTSGDGLVNFDELTKFLKTVKTLMDTDKTVHQDSSFMVFDIFNEIGVKPGEKLTKSQFLEKCKHSEYLTNLFRFKEHQSHK